MIASLLYVDLVSLLEEGVASQMSRTKFEALEDLKGRIDHLADSEKVLIERVSNGFGAGGTRLPTGSSASQPPSSLML